MRAPGTRYQVPGTGKFEVAYETGKFRLRDEGVVRSAFSR
jgi:hypothetical protein